MKLRRGFVSNSSSSSYVVIGVKLTDEDISKLGDVFKIKDEGGYVCLGTLQYKLYKQYKIQSSLTLTDPKNNPESLSPVIGWSSKIDNEICKGYEDDLEEALREVQQSIDKVSQFLIGIKEREIKIYSGTNSC